MINLNEKQLEQLNNKFYHIKKNTNGDNEVFPFFDANRNKIYKLFANVFYQVYLLNLGKINVNRNELNKKDELYIEEIEFKNLLMEFFTSIHSKYGEHFQNEFDYSKLEKIKKLNDLSDANGIFNQETGEIVLNNFKTLNDCRVYAHEYTHKLSYVKENDNQFVFGEMLPKLIEYKFFMFLNNKGYQELDILKMKFRLFENCYKDLALFLFIYPLYSLYNIKGNLTNKDINNLLLKNIIMYNNENDVITNLNMIINDSKVRLRWRHCFGTILACSLNQNFTNYGDCYNIIEAIKTLDFNELASKLLCYNDEQMISSMLKEYKSFINFEINSTLKNNI